MVLLKTYLQKNDLTNIYYYINLVEAIVRQQRLCLPCRESPRFCRSCKDETIINARSNFRRYQVRMFNRKQEHDKNISEL